MTRQQIKEMAAKLAQQKQQARQQREEEARQRRSARRDTRNGLGLGPMQGNVDVYSGGVAPDFEEMSAIVDRRNENPDDPTARLEHLNASMRSSKLLDVELGARINEWDFDEESRRYRRKESTEQSIAQMREEAAEAVRAQNRLIKQGNVNGEAYQEELRQSQINNLIGNRSQQFRLRGNARNRFNKGGMATDPNAILTPGEAVFTPDMSKSIGYDNLANFNKTGDMSMLPKFNSGGISKVPGVGSTDSVPAYLPTGSFVVKKSSSANLPGFNRGTASSNASSMQKMIGDFISFTKTFFNNLSATLPTMKASETANSTTLAAEKKAGNVQQVNNDIILLPQKLDESFRVFDSVTTKFITNFNPLINQLDNAVTRLEALPALQVQLDAKVGPVEVVLNGVELLNAFGDRIKSSILGAVAQQIAKLVPNADGSPKGNP
jgi:hypothetical protein